MKFIAAKCPNCGAKIKIEKGRKIYTCDYCRYDILFDDNGHFDLDKLRSDGIDVTKIGKTIGIFAIIPFVTFFVVAFMIVLTTFRVFSSSNDSQVNEISTSTFNIFIDSNGSKLGAGVTSILENCISNMEEYGKIITIYYDEILTSDIDEIKNIILEIDRFSYYDVLSYKDEDGYVNKIVITLSE